MFMSNTTTEFASSGWTLCGCREVVGWRAQRSVRIARIVEQHQATLIEAWNEYFNY